MRRLKILIWHVHGSYLYYLTQAPHDFYLPSKPDRTGDYVGRWGHIPWGPNVHDVPVGEVRNLNLDCIIFQLPQQYLQDQFDILSSTQRTLPKIYLQHDPPFGPPAETTHMVDDPTMTLVHVTPFNHLMWNSGRTPATVIDHGVFLPRPVTYKGDLERGVVIINHLGRRGRKLGADIFADVRKHVPLDLIGMAADEVEGGLSEVQHDRLPEFISHYRFSFSPIRYTSLGLALIESMMVGLPIVGMATTELPMVIENGVSGYLSNDINELIGKMRRLLESPAEARRLGEGARRAAERRFNIGRFIGDWNRVLERVTGASRVPQPRMEVVL